MEKVYYVVYEEWCIDYESGHLLLGVFESKDEAKSRLKMRVETVDKVDADKYGYKIYTDNDYCFDSGADGEYVSDHIFISIETYKEGSEHGSLFSN